MFNSIKCKLRLALMPIVALLTALACAVPAHANWTLSNAERAQFLEYYAPIILKRGNSNKGDHGKDWITNFDFDRDFVFSDNKREWNRIGSYVDAAASGNYNTEFASWEIRPTLYTYLIEYMDNGQKNLVLLYHVYHAMDVDAEGINQLHDWERIEIHIQNVSTVKRPGYGEQIKFAVITQHSRSVRRFPSDGDFNLMTGASGKHLMIWQAEWSGKLGGPHGQELRFIEDSWARVSSDMARNKKAEVEIIGTSKDKNVHYAFVPGNSISAVSAFNARSLDFESTASLTSYYDNGNTVSWSKVPRIQYELQDIADIIPTHWAGGDFEPHWTSDRTSQIRVDTPFKDRAGRLISGLQTFNNKSLDPEPIEHRRDGRSGYPSKSWLWGTYEIREVCDVKDGAIIGGGLFGIGIFGFIPVAIIGGGAYLLDSDGLKESVCIGKAKTFSERAYDGTAFGDRQNTRLTASGYADARSRYWGQHDYFVHSGVENKRDGYESGFWLTKGWQLPSRGGFDGRWVSLFPNNVTTAPKPLSVSLQSNPINCAEYASFTATVSGGKGPYSHQWKIGTSVRYSVGGRSSTFTLQSGVPYTVTIRDADGKSVSRAARYNMQCNGGNFSFR